MKVKVNGKTVKGCVVWRGLSMLDGRTPIVVVATRGGRGSKANRKTGAGIQVYILVDGEQPTETVKNGSDAAVCGNCPHRGTARIEKGRLVHGKGRTCYVNVGQGVGSTWKAYKRGVYPELPPALLEDFFRGEFVRLGSYGDPAAAPAWVWEMTTSVAGSWTGYTHQWRTAPRDFARYCMASCETEADRREAHQLGYRTFRVLAHGQSPLPGEEVLCPASEEAEQQRGKRTQCNRCKLCSGTHLRARDVAIYVHGSKIANDYVGRYYAALLKDRGDLFGRGETSDTPKAGRIPLSLLN